MAQTSPGRSQSQPQSQTGRYDQQQSYRGVAPVRHRHRPHLGDTADLPVVEPSPSTPADQRPAPRPVQPPRGMVVRRRWRRLRSGAGWTWTGLSILLVCWGIWVVSVRGTDLLGPVIGLALVLATGALMFVLAQLIGRAVWRRLRRERQSAWPSHLTVCVFFTMAGLTFLQQTWWVQGSWRWVTDSWQWLGDAWGWLIGLWPL